MGLPFACISKQTADQSLKDDSQREVVMPTSVHHQAYMKEMMQEIGKRQHKKQHEQ